MNFHFFNFHCLQVHIYEKVIIIIKNNSFYYWNIFIHNLLRFILTFWLGNWFGLQDFMLGLIWIRTLRESTMLRRNAGKTIWLHLVVNF
jgi:hypothetical protein